LEAVTNAASVISCLDAGSSNYKTFVEERFVEKVKSLHDTISFKPLQTENSISGKQKSVKISTDDEENNSAVSFIQYATSRGNRIENLLSFPITSRPIYLLEKDSLNPKKANKGALTTTLLKSLDKESIIVSEGEEHVPHTQTTAVIVDFMSVVRRFSAVKINRVTSFGQFNEILLNAIVSYGNESDSIHVILENYSELSVKAAERVRRASAQGKNVSAPLHCDVVSDEQTLPPSFDDFFRRTSNKISFQNFFLNYCGRHYELPKPLYIAGGDKSDPEKCTKFCGGTCEEANIYRASHEEADDRLMFSINKLYETFSECTITVISPDADIFVTLLYHLNNTWLGMKLYLLKKGRVKDDKVTQNELYPLHKLVSALSVQVVNNLPAGHALTGCDSVSKVGTKASLLKVLQSDSNLIQDFGLDVLDEEMMDRAEGFLVKVVCTKAFNECISFNELRAKMYLQLRDKKFIQLPCSSNEIRQNIRRAYYQTRMWLESAHGDTREILNVEDFGFDNSFAPTWFSWPNRPLDIPLPCKCKSCVRRTCPCREKEISCSNYCKCVGSCKNPN
jgi:hypothetical protein